MDVDSKACLGVGSAAGPWLGWSVSVTRLSALITAPCSRSGCSSSIREANLPPAEPGQVEPLTLSPRRVADRSC